MAHRLQICDRWELNNTSLSSFVFCNQPLAFSVCALSFVCVLATLEQENMQICVQHSCRRTYCVSIEIFHNNFLLSLFFSFFKLHHLLCVIVGAHKNKKFKKMLNLRK